MMTLPLLRSVILATGVAGLLPVCGTEGIQSTVAASRKDIGVRFQLASAPERNLVLDDNLRQTDATIAEFAGAVAAPSVALNKPELTAQTDSADSKNGGLTQSAPVQVASVDPLHIEIGDANRVVNSIEITDECLVIEVCVDRYLWALYQRTPKEDTIKVPERRSVTVKRKGRMVTVTKTFTKLVDQDFEWKDPKAAERAGMSMPEYVIGGMDRSFKLKLFYLLQAAEAAGLSPGITSAFRDDYRQSIASGLKAAINKSYHGGSSRGGYGHGLAADIVSVQGETRDQRWASSDKLWKWVDARGNEFGIGRPYLGRDPPHVAPVDGREYAAHTRGAKQARLEGKKLKRVALRTNVNPAKRSKIASIPNKRMSRASVRMSLAK